VVEEVLVVLVLVDLKQQHLLQLQQVRHIRLLLVLEVLVKTH